MIEKFDIMMKRIPNFDSQNYNTDWRWLLLQQLYGRNYAGIKNRKNAPPKIPKIIHQIWLGSELPTKYKTWAKSWKKLNPDWEYKLWTDVDVDSLCLPNRELYDSITNFGPKSDILRYHILNKFGGLYIDTDFECLKNFDEFSYLDFYTSVGYPSKVEIYPGLIACVPNHPIIQKLTEEIDKISKSELELKGPLEVTSSYFFTRVFFKLNPKYKKGIVAFPPDYFYPFPNHKGHQNEDGRKYIKESSYAIHYWEVSWSPKAKDLIDWIQGDKFVKMADVVYSPNKKASDDYAKYPNTFNPADLKEVNIVYTNTMYLKRLLDILEFLPNKFVVMSHNGDQHTEKGVIGTYANGKRISAEPYTLPDNVLKMYVQNVDVVDPRISTIPLGLENSMWKTEKKRIMHNLMMQVEDGNLKRDELVYMNHSTNTRFEERKMLYDVFGRYDWITTVAPGSSIQALQDYFINIATHKFIMNPWGNCFDNHRMWEAWYLGCIPITRRCIFTSFYEDFPICLIDSWDEVTEDFLNKEYERISNLDWDKNKLTFQYWETKVRAIQ